MVTTTPFQTTSPFYIGQFVDIEGLKQRGGTLHKTSRFGITLYMNVLLKRTPTHNGLAHFRITISRKEYEMVL